MEKIMQKIVSVTVLMLGMALLAGCGEKKQEEGARQEQDNTVIEIQKDGSIVETVTEDFFTDIKDEKTQEVISRREYDEEKLKTMALSKAAAYNKVAGSNSVSVDKLNVEDGVASIVFKYENMSAYSACNTNDFDDRGIFFGTVKEAFDAGYSLDVTMKNVKNEESVGKDALMQMGESYIVITTKPLTIKTFGNILYVGENITLEGKNTARLQGNEQGASLGQYYILFK